jgi:hypothetical protein
MNMRNQMLCTWSGPAFCRSVHGRLLVSRALPATAVAVVLIAYLKVRLVFLDFMELRTAPLPLRLSVEAWAALVCGAVVALYWSGLARYPASL